MDTRSSLRKRIGSVLLTLVVVLSVTVAGIAIQPAAAATTSVSTCTTIDSPGVYELTSDISNTTALTCVEITVGDVILDGQGHTINGSGLRGISVKAPSTSQLSNVTVRNVALHNWSVGLYAYYLDGGTVRGVTTRNVNTAVSSTGLTSTRIVDSDFQAAQSGIEHSEFSLYPLNNLIANNTITGDGSGTDDDGIQIDGGGGDGPSNHTIENNTVSGFVRGITLTGTTNNSLIENTVHSNDNGIVLEGSSKATLRGNAMANNDVNLDAAGQISKRSWAVEGFTHDIDTSNTVDGKPVYYLVNASGVTIDQSSNAGFVAAVNSQDITIQDLTLSNNSHGVALVNTTNSLVENVSATHVSEHGVLLGYVNDSTVANSTLADSGGADGIALKGSHRNVVANNTVTNIAASLDAGIWLDNSNQNLIRNNTVADTTLTTGIDVSDGHNNTIAGNDVSRNRETSSDGIQLSSAPDTTVLGNTVDDNSADGISVSSTDGFTIQDNLVRNNDLDGIYLYNSPNGSLCNNTLSGNGGGIVNDSASVYDTDCTKSQPPANQPPTASFTYSPNSPESGQTITFDASGSSDSDGSIATYEWDFDGDGQYDDASGVSPTTSYSAGDYPVSLRVTDDDGTNDTTSQTVTVTVASVGGGSGLVVEQDQPACVAPGGKITAVVNATDLDELRILPSYQGYLTQSDMSVMVDGQPYTFGDPIIYNTPKNGPIGVTVDLTNTRLGTVALEYYDSSGSLVAVTGPTSVHDNPISVPTDFNNIQEAVDVACSGSTIEVADGTYSEVLTVEKDLTITNATGASPTLENPGAVPGNHLLGVQNGATVSVSRFTIDSKGARGGIGAYTAATVTVQDVTVNGSSGTAGLSANDATLVAEDVTVQDAGSVGMMAKDGGELTVQHATIDGTGDSGVVARDSGVATINDATIRNTGLAGVTALTSGNATVADSTITATDYHGVFSHTDGKAALSNVTISNVADDGAMVTYGGELSIHNSSIRDVPGNATRVTDSGSQLTVADSTISNASAYGVYSESAEAHALRNDVSDVALGFGYRDGGGTIVDNTIQSNGHAIQADDASLHVEGNDIDAYGLGVDAMGGAIVSVDHNEIQSGYQAVHVADPATAVGVIDNVLAPTTVGVGVYTGAYSSIRDNQIVSGTDGLSFNGNYVSANAINNTIMNVDDGIFVVGADVTLRENHVSGTTNTGIYVRDTATKSHVERNDISNAGTYGLHLINATASVVDNTVTTASYNGIFVDASTASVDGNRVTDANTGISTRDTNGTIDGNVIRTVYDGLTIIGGTGVLTNNTVENVTGKGIEVTEKSRTLTNNSVRGGQYGLWANANVTAKLNSFTGAYKGIRLADAAGGSTMRFNDLSNNTWAIENDATVGATPSAPLNYFGPRGPTDDSIANDVDDLEPFLTKPPGEVDTDLDHLQAWGLDLEYVAGDVYAFGTPGPMAENLSTVFGDFDGAIYTYDETTQSWTLATGEEVLGPMDAVVVIPQNDTRAVVDFADATPAEPTTRDLREGWNFVAPRSYTDADDGYSTNTTAATDLLDLYEEAADQPGTASDSFLSYSFGSGNPPSVSPFAGQFVYVTEAGTIPGRVPKGVTVNQGEGPLDYTVPTENFYYVFQPISWNFQLLTLPTDDPEIVIGAPGSEAAYVVTGGLDGQVSLADANATFEHGTPDTGIGESVTSVGDVNGDGETDYLLGGPSANGGAGEAYLFYGPVSGTLDAANADVTFVGEGQSNAGDAVAAAGDVNGDGLADLLIGAPNYDDPASGHPAGAAYLVYGRSGDQELGGEIDLALANARMAGWKYDGYGERAGTSVASAGDLNGDGYDDILVGAPGMWSSDNGDVTVHGGAYVVFGGYEGPGGTAPRGHWYLSDYADLHSSDTIRVTAIEGAGGDAGESVAGAGDVDGDGYDDFLIGAPRTDRDVDQTDTGAVILVYGGFEATETPENVVLFGSETGARAGRSLAGVGDVDGDGYDDFLVGSPNAADGGKVYLIYGNGNALTSAVSVFGATVGELSHAQATFVGTGAGDAAGAAVAGVGDLDGDTRADFIISAPLNDAGPGSDAGAVYVLHGESFEGEIDLANADVIIVGNADSGLAGLSADGGEGE